jgi:uncharacterized iron-regulated membrane protein
MIRLPQRETKLMVAVHGWLGVVLGLLLYAVIVTGTAAVFAQEIKLWSAGSLGPSDPFARPLESLVRRLAAETPEEYRDDLSIRRTGAGNLAFFFHSHVKVDGQVREKGVLYEVAADDRVVARREGLGLDVLAAEPASTLGRFFVELHVRLHLPDPWGLILTGILGIAMLAAAVSGLLMHRHLLRDIFTLRPGAQRLVSRRDLHTVAGTWILPHAFVLAFTGAFFSFAISVGVPVLAKIAFNGDQPAMIEALIGMQKQSDPRPQVSASLDTILTDAYRRADAPVAFISIDHWDRADAHITIRHLQKDGALMMTTLTYAGATSAFIAEKPILGTKPSVGGSAFALMGPLHFGNFAGWWSKAIWFALGAASAYVTWSGLALWVRRREEKPGWRALGRLTAWCGAGLPFAMAASAVAFFLTLQAGTAAFWTPAAFLIAAALALLPALIARADRIAPLLFGATGIVLLALPVLRIATGGPGWPVAFAAGQLAIPALDILLSIGSIACLLPARTFFRAPETTEAQPRSPTRAPSRSWAQPAE